jgi:outer membrane protease
MSFTLRNLIIIFRIVLMLTISSNIYTWQNNYVLFEDNKLHLCVSPILAVKYGEVKEYVFGGGKKVSELDWDVKPLICVGIDAEVNYKKFYLKGSCSQAVNSNTGHIKDYDWDASTGKWTNYSKHD